MERHVHVAMVNVNSVSLVLCQVLCYALLWWQPLGLAYPVSTILALALAAGDVRGLIEDIVKPLPSLLLLLLPCPPSLSETPLPQSLSSLNACSVTSLEMTPNGTCSSVTSLEMTPNGISSSATSLEMTPNGTSSSATSLEMAPNGISNGDCQCHNV